MTTQNVTESPRLSPEMIAEKLAVIYPLIEELHEAGCVTIVKELASYTTQLTADVQVMNVEDSDINQAAPAIDPVQIMLGITSLFENHQFAALKFILDRFGCWLSFKTLLDEDVSALNLSEVDLKAGCELLNTYILRNNPVSVKVGESKSIWTMNNEPMEKIAAYPALAEVKEVVAQADLYNLMKYLNSLPNTQRVLSMSLDDLGAVLNHTDHLFSEEKHPQLNVAVRHLAGALNNWGKETIVKDDGNRVDHIDLLSTYIFTRNTTTGLWELNGKPIGAVIEGEMAGSFETSVKNRNLEDLLRNLTKALKGKAPGEEVSSSDRLDQILEALSRIHRVNFERFNELGAEIRKLKP